jgi:ABC-type phosphate transport system permease subunit
MEITDTFLVTLSSLIIAVSGAVICAVNYRRVCPVRREEVVVIEAPEWK